MKLASGGRDDPQSRSRAEGAGELLEVAVGLESALLAALRRAVPSFADWCVVDFYGADHQLTALHTGYPQAGQHALLLEILRPYRLERRENGDVLASLDGGKTVPYSEMRRMASVPLSPDETRLLDELGLKSSFVMPMHDAGEPLGVVSFVSMQRQYEDDDLAAAHEFSEGCARVLRVMRDENEARRSTALLDTLWTTTPVGLGLVDRDLCFRRVNERLAAVAGLPPSAHIGQSLVDVLGGLGVQLNVLCRRVLDDRRPITNAELSASTGSGHGASQDWLVSLTPIILGGRVAGVSLVVQDITARKRAETRAKFLAHAGEILDSSLDYGQTLRRIARLAVPDIADWCSISMLDERGQMYRLAVAHADPDMDRLAQELIEREPLPPDAPAGAAAVMHSARTQSVEDFSDETLVNSLKDQRSIDIVRKLGLGSSVSVPLIAHGRLLGAISLIGKTRFRFGAKDVGLAEQLARRAAVSIDNARLYTEHTRIARTLQAGLLPRRLPEIPSLELAARYRPAGELNEVGGDFYDVYLRSAGEWLVVIGDVTGKGAKAAATTALVRYTLRAAALRPGSARALLGELNSAMLAQDASFCTVALISIHPQAVGTAELSVCLAGHPAPLLLRGQGGVTEVGTYGTVMGYTEHPELTETRVELGLGDVLLLYTDGLTEAAPPGWTDAQLRERVGALPKDDLDGLLAALEAAAVAAAGDRPRDDIALLALRAAPRPS